MNLILVFREDFVDGMLRVRLTGRRLTHVREVLRAKEGDELCVGLLGARLGTGKITSLGTRALEMDVTLTTPPPRPLPVTLVLALPRPPVLKRVLLTASSFGVKKIFLIQTNRVEKSFWKSPVLCPEKIREQLVLGLEQAKDTVLPEVALRKRFKPFVEDELPGIVKGTLPLVAHPDGGKTCPHTVEEAVTLMIGPEGGLVPFEIEKLAACGFTPVALGERILRVETAVPALLGRLF